MIVALDTVTDIIIPAWVTTILPLPKGLEPLGKRRKESGRRRRPARAERAGASESLGRGEGKGDVENPDSSKLTHANGSSFSTGFCTGSAAVSVFASAKA